MSQSYANRVKEQQGVRANLGGDNQFCAINLNGGLERYAVAEFEECFWGYRAIKSCEITTAMIEKFGSKDIERGLIIKESGQTYLIIPTDPWMTTKDLLRGVI